MQLTSENYYSQEANKEYMSVSGYKDFAGTYGKMPCEFYGMEKLNGRWEDEKSTALLVGSYVDSYFEGSLNQFKEDNPEIFTQKGELKANFKQAEEIIARIERDEYFMKYMSGQKQVIMTGELFGAKWKIKMDSYIPGVAIVDLKVMASITDLKWVKDIGYLDFVRYWGYDIQGAVYQEIVRQNTGEKLPFFIAGATKQTEPDIRIIHVTDRVTTKDDWRARRELQLRAARECNRLLALIGIAKSSFHLKNKRVKFWTGKVLKVRGMIRSWNESDSKRYSQIAE